MAQRRIPGHVPPQLLVALFVVGSSTYWIDGSEAEIRRAARSAVALSSRTGAVVRSYVGEAGESFGAALATDTITRAGMRDVVVGAPGALPDPEGGAAFGGLVLFDPETGAELARRRGDLLPGGAVRRLGESAAVLGHPTGAPLAWWAYGAPGSPGGDDVGTVVVTGDQALLERYRVVGRPGALFGWRLQNLFEDIDGDDSRALDFIVTAPLETRGARLREVGAVYAYSTLTGRQLYRAAGPHAYSRFGYAVASTDDHDGDGLLDVWVSAPGSPGRAIAGAVLLLSSATGAELRRIEAPSGAVQFGYAIATTFDVDGDQVRDLLVTAPGTSRSARKKETGLVVLYSGRTGAELRRWEGTSRKERLGVAVAVTASLADTERRLLIAAGFKRRGRLDFHRVDGGRTRRIKGSRNARFGHGLQGLQDLDGDGFPEILVAMPGAPPLLEPE